MLSMADRATAPSGLQGWLPVVVAVLRRPDLWATALRQAHTLAPSRWWASWPPIPLPAEDYLKFRTVTAYGNAEQAPLPHDVVTWLEWSQSWKAVRGGSHVAAPPAVRPHEINPPGRPDVRS